MPNYGVAQAGSPGGNNLTEIQPGDLFYLFNAESPTAPQASVAVAMGYVPNNASGQVVFTVHWAAAPTAALVIQGSHVDVDAQYQTLTTFTNVQDGYYADVGGFAFYRAKLSSQSAGGAVTVIAKR